MQQWEVYYVQNCRHAKPQPKNKFVVVACLDGGASYGFFINSRINRFIKQQPHLLVCEAQVLNSEHSFLHYDSWLDCRDIYLFNQAELTDYCGNLSNEAIQAALQSVQACTVLRRRFKGMIVQQYSAHP